LPWFDSGAVVSSLREVPLAHAIHSYSACVRLRDKTDPIVEKVTGTEDQRSATAVKRLEIREILGTKTMREITLK
jgi:hypothetical protein